ncbi:NADPH-dependent F420 reductase [Kitasatospora sp. NBC_00240]|uniref:NADPH-dependent F420 reductase n=1 Tax=Kitasatospora sp. NBC_00240 TaxID=2903567 RepID=UPI002256A459|nr:NADPH-dependent F420 reductase [Kitasatospora sp. NBC_00240]MCX5207737.1 NADPH-dependent F420 reductase [Kitasatospora sp. NBC_00240]MCX5215364.1 NADPH-dependent F420 reductase [Kitasatospora sp. NBC_00240]MCX5216075.1 NADPH-dependent F420 reductase [Kitasatospora sp. NBC_00240]
MPGHRHRRTAPPAAPAPPAPAPAAGRRPAAGGRRPDPSSRPPARPPARRAARRHPNDHKSQPTKRNRDMPTLGIIGSGSMGTAIARLAVAADVKVAIANSRGPETLTALVSELGPLAGAGTVEQIAQDADLIVLAVPILAYRSVPAAPLRGHTVLDTSNYYPIRDGRIPELDSEKLTTSELVQQHLEGAHLVKAFGNILAHHITQLARPSGAPDRTALPIAGDHAAANTAAAALVDRIGFDTLDTGPLADSWRFEPETTAYTWLYMADQNTAFEDRFEAPGAPFPIASLRTALLDVKRVRVAERTF